MSVLGAQKMLLKMEGNEIYWSSWQIKQSINRWCCVFCINLAPEAQVYTQRDPSIAWWIPSIDNEELFCLFSSQRPRQSTSRYAENESDDGGASDSVGIPEPLPEYEYPSRVQGRTIQEMQEIRETVRLRGDDHSSSSTSSETGRRRSPVRGAPRDHHFSRHFDISAEELNTARSLIHHRLPPSYGDQNQQQPLNQVESRLSLADQQSRTPPPTRPILGSGGGTVIFQFLFFLFFFSNFKTLTRCSKIKGMLMRWIQWR